MISNLVVALVNWIVLKALGRHQHGGPFHQLPRMPSIRAGMNESVPTNATFVFHLLNDRLVISTINWSRDSGVIRWHREDG
jgi:hypothetical protein